MDCGAILELAVVLDWSAFGLDLPQISEESVTCDPTQSSRTAGLERIPSGDVSDVLAEVSDVLASLGYPLMWMGPKIVMENARLLVLTRIAHLALMGVIVLQKRPRPWVPIIGQFSHAKDCPIIEDPYSVAHLVRHFKPDGCLLPSLQNMTERDTYVKMVIAHAKAMEAKLRVYDFGETLARHSSLRRALRDEESRSRVEA
ncbi:hypothetical protein IGI04_015054 [Brassica rapa subsp. trilocularis]|uniref:Uncharacterized protein n=1 Tax=Brassica rapa subsp. trilocularis TaxID=1813537 RepID=A0ABQ7MP28_BRACM|nr:hypothetical protein IGI04_015054 [Brassica rapa subsp. trilocularis]